MTGVNAPGPAMYRVVDRFRDPPVAVRDGVASWTTVVDPPSGVAPETVSALVAAMEDSSLRDALSATVGRTGDANGSGGVESNEYATRNALFVDAADAWRIPVADAIGGRCLDVNAGFGTRSMLLAELSASVDAVDTELASLSFLARRDDYACGDRVTPIHAEPSALPEPTTPYDTVVADLTGRNRPDSLSTAVGHLADHLAPDGTLLLVLDGWPRLSGITDLAGIGGRSELPRSVTESLRLGRSGYERSLLGAGFDTVDLYGLVPGPADPSYVVPVDDVDAVRRLLDVGVSNGTGIERLLSCAADLGHRTGLLDRCWPAYLAVCYAGGGSIPSGGGGDAGGGGDLGVGDLGGGSYAGGGARSESDRGEGSDGAFCPETSGLLTRGGGRSTILVDDDGALSGVTKVPHRRAHAEFSLDEYRTMRHLRADDRRTDPPGILTDHDAPSIPETIPDGSLTMTRFGPTYHEDPAHGTPLAGAITPDPERFRRVLELGFDWLLRMQVGYGEEGTERSPEVVREDLTVPELDLYPPEPVGPVRLFDAPCHGDFHPKNVFVGGMEGTSTGAQPRSETTIGPVTAVIDWELGGLADNPFVDSAFFALQTARLTFGGLEAGIDAAFASPGPYADALREVVGAYCDAVGLSRRGFITCLPAVWIRRLRRCADRGATASYSGRAVRRTADVRLIWDRQSEISAVIGTGS